MKYLTFEKESNSLYLIKFKNNKLLGKLIFDTSTWFFISLDLSYNDYMLQEIVDKLKELNQPIDNAGTK